MNDEQAVVDLQTQLAELKAQFEKVLKLKGIPGRIGPPGDIHGAVVNAKEAAERVATEAAKRAVVYPFTNVVEQIRAEVAKLSEEFRELKSYLDERIENAVINHVVQTLQDYGVLDKHMNPLNKTHLNTHLKQLGILKS